jgi:pimeloyl-ACP methyl ester carboxylesterase
VLVGHSYGGDVITNAATGDTQVKALVYVDAFDPAQNQTLAQLLAAYPGSCAAPQNLTVWPVLSAQGWTIWPAGEQALIASLSLVPVGGRPPNIRLDPPRRRQHALLDFLASKLIRRKSQQVWPSEATVPRRARRRRSEQSA